MARTAAQLPGLVCARRTGARGARAWREAIAAILRGSRTTHERVCCGAGPLEDLIRANSALSVERTEELASRDSVFRQALDAAWITLKDVPEPLARRYFKASGRELQILDAPPGWNADDPDSETSDA